ncbi:hypothetical protein PRIPAC_96156 [Pristionchus pacificus]|uniref:Uncharacterized protein n=1 Tax=Pristionchus pacificus TaxID=54126 RepID=A0A2A6CUC9_PRIPA|nr:hypothetical protein PRIPAC_96156 [Pristionchus pacificus]|eukprot:PDM81844.1 hypothetical protein PRIPAC_33998 [Pristionchus pacificus]
MFTYNSISETLDSKHFEDPEKKKKKLLLSTNTFADLKTQLPNEAKYKNFVLPTYFSSWLNIKKSVTALTGVTRKGMKGLLEIMHIELKGRHHSGIDDVKNIVEITKWLLKKGHVIKNEDASTNRIGAT